MKSVIPLKKKVNESLSSLQELVDKNKLSIGCKLNGPLRGRVLNLYENGIRFYPLFMDIFVKRIPH